MGLKCRQSAPVKKFRRYPIICAVRVNAPSASGASAVSTCALSGIKITCRSDTAIACRPGYKKSPLPFRAH